MKFFLQTLMVIVLGFILELFLPWWAIAIAASLAGIFMGGNVSRSFSAGFLGLFLLWFMSAQALMVETGSSLGEKVGMLLPGHPSAIGLAAISGLVAGLVGAFSAAAGDSLRSLIVPKKKA